MISLGGVIEGPGPRLGVGFLTSRDGSRRPHAQSWVPALSDSITHPFLVWNCDRADYMMTMIGVVHHSSDIVSLQLHPICNRKGKATLVANCTTRPGGNKMEKTDSVKNHENLAGRYFYYLTAAGLHDNQV